MSDSHQAIYDAVRSRIHNGDVGAVVREVAWQQFDISFEKAAVRDEFLRAAAEAQRPSVLFRPSIGLDGNKYCALYGDDLMQGCAGFGDTAEEAMRDFDRAWVAQKAPQLVASGVQ